MHNVLLSLTIIHKLQKKANQKKIPTLSVKRTQEEYNLERI